MRRVTHFSTGWHSIVASVVSQHLPLFLVLWGGIGLVSRDQKLLNQVKFGGIRLLNEAEVLEGLQRCLEQSQLSGPEKPNSPGSGPLIVGLSHTRPLSDPQCRSLWYRDARLRM